MSARGMPIGMRAVTLGIYTAARFGMAATLTNDVQTLTGSPPIDFADFAAAYRDVWEHAEGGDRLQPL